MKNLLIEISRKAIKYENLYFSPEQIENQWLGNIPATESEILNAEFSLGVKLPEDYIEFLKITNGFSAPNNIYPSFEKIDEIDYLINVDAFIIEAYGLIDLETAIIIGGKSEEQSFLLLPPNSANEKWRYWKFADWYPGEEPVENLKAHFEEVHRFITKEHEP